MTAERPVVELSGLRRGFGDGAAKRTVLGGVDLKVQEGEVVAIVGASGSGKTTLLNVIGALDDGFEGKAEIFGESLKSLDDDRRTGLRNRMIGFVFQSYHLLEHLSVIENVKLPLWLNGGSTEAEEESRATEALRSVGLDDRIRDGVGPLSGGERQRVAIARAIVNNPRLILADEPTGNLDQETGGGVYDLFDQIRKNREGCAVVIVTHDLRLAQRADRVLRLRSGRLDSEEQDES